MNKYEQCNRFNKVFFRLSVAFSKIGNAGHDQDVSRFNEELEKISEQAENRAKELHDEIEEAEKKGGAK